MVNIAMLEDKLRSGGYSPQTEMRSNYRGCMMAPHAITQVTAGGFRGYAAEIADPAMLGHLRRIQAVQDKIPHIANIHQIFDDVLVTETARGTLLWELETAHNYVANIRTCLEEIRTSLKSVELVHADIRPWNIMFDEGSRRATLFDWGFSFFVNTPPFGNLDNHLAARGFNRSMGHEITRLDIENCIAILETRKSPEEIWNHGPHEFSWRPGWCKPFTPSVLRSNQGLLPGQLMRSENDRYRLVYQADGNLVIYDGPDDRHAVWHAGTHGTRAGYFVMQQDGNAVIYDGNRAPIWSTLAQGASNAWLSLENDGLLVIQIPGGRIWASK